MPTATTGQCIIVRCLPRDLFHRCTCIGRWSFCGCQISNLHASLLLYAVLYLTVTAVRAAMGPLFLKHSEWPDLTARSAEFYSILKSYYTLSNLPVAAARLWAWLARNVFIGLTDLLIVKLDHINFLVISPISYSHKFRWSRVDVSYSLWWNFYWHKLGLYWLMNK